VGIPGSDGVSRIANKAVRMDADEHYQKFPQDFYYGYSSWEADRVHSLLAQIQEYPVTQYSREFIQKIDKIVQLARKEWNILPVFFLEHEHPIALHTATPEAQPTPTMTILYCNQDSSRTWNDAEAVQDLLRGACIQTRNFINYFPITTLPEFQAQLATISGFDEWNYDGRRWDGTIEKLIAFVSSTPIGQESTSLQMDVYNALKKVPELQQRRGFFTEFDVRLKRAARAKVSSLVNEYKQQRPINSYIAQKNRILDEKIPVIGSHFIDILSFLPHYRTQIEIALAQAMTQWGILTDD
jgi:hypothetical protein